MANMETPEEAAESLGKLVIRLLWELAKLVLPIVAVAMLAPWAALALVATFALLTGLCARLGWRRVAAVLSWLLTAAVIGLSFSLFASLSAWWAVPLCALLLLFGLALVASYEKRLGLAKAKPQTAEIVSSNGPSAWGGGDLQTPEGETIRTFAWGEIAMGGPTYGSYLFPDGVLLEGLGASVRFSSSGRYFAAPLPSRERWGLLILDRQQRRVYRNAEIGEFWEIDEFSDEAIGGRHSPLVGNQGYRMPLAELLAQSEGVDLVAVRDLWLEPGWSVELGGRDFPAPAAAHRLRGVPYLPETLRDLEDPLLPLRYPALRLEIDGEPSDLLLAADELPLWRDDGQALVCRIGRAWPKTLWLWQAGQGWRELPEPWVTAEAEPGLLWDEPCALSQTELHLQGRLATAQLDHLGFGYQLQHYYGEVETVIGHDPEGRLLLGEQQGAGLTRVLPLEAKGVRGEGAVLGEAMTGGESPRFEWRLDSREGRLGAYACRIGDWQLEGEWLLDHRVSDCGRYLALIAFAEAPAVPHRLCVANLQRRTLLEFAQRPLIAGLLGFRAGVLSLACIVGRLGREERDTALHRYDQAAPAAEQAAGFVERDEHSRLYLRSLALRVAADGLQALPGWRLVECPQVANADGDFILPAPGGRDAAWLFGAQSEYRDGYPRERHPRGDGCLLTASGMGLADVGPAMIWSEDGRYLVLTRHVPRLQAVESADSDRWHLLLLDLQARTLRQGEQHLGCMPHFLRFDAHGLEWRVLPTDWEHEDSASEWQACRQPLGALLALPAVALQPCGELWLPAAELARGEQWQGLDRRHLQAWCNMR